MVILGKILVHLAHLDCESIATLCCDHETILDLFRLYNVHSWGIGLSIDVACKELVHWGDEPCSDRVHVCCLRSCLCLCTSQTQTRTKYQFLSACLSFELNLNSSRN